MILWLMMALQPLVAGRPREDVLWCFFLSLNPNQAFAFAVDIWFSFDERTRFSDARLQASASRRDGLPMLLAHILAMLTKRLLYNLKNIPQFVVQILIPIALFFCVHYVCHRTTTNVDSIIVGPSTIEMGRCVLNVAPGTTYAVERYRRLLSDGCELLDLTGTQEFYKDLLKEGKELPRLAVGLHLNDSWGPAARVHAWYNPNGFHTAPLLINIVDTVRLQTKTDNDQAKIITGIHVFPINTEYEAFQAAKDTLLRKAVMIPLVLIALSILTSGFVVMLVEERTSNFQHQQLLTKLHPVIYWAASIVYDILLCTLVFAVGLLILYAGDVLGFEALTGLAGFWALYLWACLPFIYCLSCLFTTAAKDNTLLIIWQVISPLVAAVIVFIIMIWITYEASISQKEKDHTKLKVALVPLQFLFPPFAMCMGIVHVIIVEYKAEERIKEIFDTWWVSGLPAIAMGVFGALMAVLFVLLSSRTVRRVVLAFTGAACIHRKQERYQDADEDVAAEREYVTDLMKWFGCKSQPAVDQITFAVEPGQCFGLLGTNGAGKTTTIDILTGLKVASGGAIRLYGQPDTQSSVLAAVGMSNDGDKRIKFCSGGQKRKISVGVALLAQDAIRILDEPTAGVDPKARRDIWMHLDLSRQPPGHTAQLLTSHSMEECEALCTKISIMIKGRMVAIGSSQHLKSKYSGGYTMTVELKPDESGEKDPVKLHELMVASVEAVTQAMTAFFPEIKIKEAGASRTCIYVVPSTTLPWSAAWTAMNKLCADPKLQIADYSVTQCGLEDTFLKVTAEANTEAS
ncbi:unnamed protein product, partial [Mesorhabditis spiculigera]